MGRELKKYACLKICKKIFIKKAYFNCKNIPENEIVTRSIGTDRSEAVDTDENRADIIQPAAQEIAVDRNFKLCRLAYRRQLQKRRTS